MELYDKILVIQLEKRNSEVTGSINSNSTASQIDVAFKDICIDLRTSKETFKVFDSEGYCELFVFNDSLHKYEIEDLSKEELCERIKFYTISLLKSKDYLKRSPTIYRNIEQTHIELNNILNALTPQISKQQIFDRYGREIEFFNNELFYNIFPSHKVEISQTGFSYEEFKNILKDIYNQVKSQHSFLYHVDFDTLIFG